MPTPVLLSIGQLSAELQALSELRPPSYNALWNMVSAGEIPAERVEKPRPKWLIRQSDIEAIAVMIGLVVPPGVKLPTRAIRPGEKLRLPYMTLAQARATLAASERKRALAKGQPKAA